MADTFMLARLDAIKIIIVNYETAINALATGTVQEYRLDTGQTITRVQKIDLAQLRQSLNSLYNQYATLNARCNGSGVTRVVPL